MKTVLGLVTLLCCSTLFGQSVDNTIYLPILMSTHEKEHERLVEIEEKQLQLSYATTAMSVSSVLMNTTEEKLHKGLIQVYNIIDNAQVIVKLVTTSGEIIALQDRVLNYAQENPETLPLAAYKEAQLMKKASSLLVQLIMATKESKFNLMNNAQRLDLLYATVSALTIIRDDMRKFIAMLKGYSKLHLLEAAQGIIGYDFQDSIDDMNTRIEMLVDL